MILNSTLDLVLIILFVQLYQPQIFSVCICCASFSNLRIRDHALVQLQQISSYLQANYFLEAIKCGKQFSEAICELFIYLKWCSLKDELNFIESNNNYNMSVNIQNQSLKTDIKDFIQLLQKNPQTSTERRKFSLDSDRLSIIYSASEPQSSLADKENSHNSSNKNEDFEQSDIIIKEIKRLGVTSEQDKYLQKLARLINDLRKSILIGQTKYKALTTQFQQEKIGTDQILKALVKMDEAEKQIWASYNDLSNRYVALEEKYQNSKEECQILKNQIVDYNKDIEFMRKLVLVANQNYETIERKCKNLERSSKMLDRFKEQRSSPEIVNRSTIVNKKSSCSPSISERSNMSTQKGSFEQNYRKLVLRTLKSKAIR